MSLTSSVLGLLPNGTAAGPLLSSTGTSFTSTFGHVKDTASSTLSYLNPSPKDLAMAVPRLLAYLGSFAFVAIPESFDYFFHLPHGGSVIAEATANKTQAIASAAISSATTMAPASAGGPVATDAAKAGLLSHMSFQHVRSFGGVFSYLTSKWALGCVAAAIILNRTGVYASARRPVYLNWYIRLALRIIPVWLFCSQISSLLQAIHCQTSPDYPSLKYGGEGPRKHLDFSGDGGLLYNLTSALLLWQDDRDSCLATGMVRLNDSPSSVGSLSLLWPLFKALCLSQFVDTLSAAVQGQKQLTETGMSIFEHSLAFAEAEAMVSNQLGLTPWGFPRTNFAKDVTNGISEGPQVDMVPISTLYDRMNTAPEVLLIGLISSLNCLTAHVLAILGLRGRYRLLNTGVWGFCFMMSFVWGFLSFKPGSGFDAIILRFPTVCIVGFIPHLLILLGISICACIYALAVFLVVLSPNPAGPAPRSIQERIQMAHDNLQAHRQMQNFQIHMHDDFYTTLLRIGFSVLTIASEAVYLNEGQKIGVGALTWLENERLKELEDAKQSFSNVLSSGVADGITLTEDRGQQPTKEADVWISGYGRERTTKSLKAGSYTHATRTGADGVGAFQRGGRYLMVWEFFNGVFWLSLAWFVTVISKTLLPIGIRWRPEWATRAPGQVARPVRTQTETKQPGPIEFWILSDDGQLSLPKDNNVDVEGETKKRLRVVSDFWGEEEEQKLDTTLYGWWKHGGWWGEQDESGTYQESIVDEEDRTSVISMSTEHDDEHEWEYVDDGSRTPTQLYPDHQRTPSPSPPMDHVVDPAYLAQLLDPKDSEQRQEARMLAAHLTSDRILTRSQYQHDKKFEKAHVLTSTRHRPPGFIPSSPSGRLTAHEEAEVLEYLIISRRAAAANTGDQTAAWRDGAEGLGAGGPQCVILWSSMLASLFHQWIVLPHEPAPFSEIGPYVEPSPQHAHTIPLSQVQLFDGIMPQRSTSPDPTF